MANAINEEILIGVKELIARITNFKVGCEQFNSLEKCIITTLKKSDTMYFLNTKDIKRAIWSMAEKFMFHGFFRHAEYLKMAHDKYIDKKLTESDLTLRLNIVKFLLCMSKSPTNHFWREPDSFIFITDKTEIEQVEDWGAYLTEGIERWSPVKDDSFQENTDSEEENINLCDHYDGASISPNVISEVKDLEPYDFKACREELLSTVQNEWFSGKVICMKPPSEWFDANVGILWEQHLRSQVQNLIEIEPVTVISEYKVMREVLWQMWGPHDSTVFGFSTNKLVPKPNVTICSVCSIGFEHFMDVFVPYIEILDEFRQFHVRLKGPNVSQTYKSYGCAVRRIMEDVFVKLIEIEKNIMEQETTMTLLKLAEQLEDIFKPVHILKIVHQEVIIENFEQTTTLECALTLLTGLRRSLEFSLSKLEQDIRLTLYLECLYYYFTTTNAWLVKNDLYDSSQEFIILNKSLEKNEINFVLQDNIQQYYDQDGIMKIICDQVLQIGRNVHLLRLLGKYDDFVKGSETIHEEFIKCFLEELANYYDCDFPENRCESPKLQKVVSNFDLNGMGDWTNYVDLSDGCLTKAFEDFYFEKVESPNSENTLFEKISNITTSLFPLQSLPEKIFSRILKERFTISGLMVKNLLIENYNLDKQFEFLNHIFLYNDDMIFPFYRRLFEKITTSSSNWGNSVWLTSHLQDILMDQYPNFCENCTVQVKENWRQCRESLEACTLLSLHYEIKWPLSIIITEEHIAMYKEIFEFILKIKWALYTVNHLFFDDIEPKTKTKKPRASQTTIKRLKYLRFNLINILNSIQHYLFGFVFAKYRIQFELDFEKSNDLKSLITSHEDFVKSIYRSVAKIRDKKLNHYGFNTLLKCTKMLKVMWNGLEYATVENLNNCRKIYKFSFDVVNGIINPVFVFN